MRSQIMVVALLLGACVPAGRLAAVDVGAVDQTQPPKSSALVVPENDDGIESVGLQVTVSGKVGEQKAGKLYVLVNPLSNPDTRNNWWIQRPVVVRGESFTGSCQFGEGSAGLGEYFAIIVVATDRPYSEGEQLQGLPPGMRYSKLKIVKRKS